MIIERILAEIDDEISRLTQVRSLLSTDGGKLSTTPVKRKRHRMSSAARKRISAAQKARWAREKANARKKV